MSEIGSEFEWQDYIISSNSKEIELPYKDNGTFTFSGRTSIELALKNISKGSKALVPSYCCDSMLEPFRNAGFLITYYDVNYDGSGIAVGVDKNQLLESDVFLKCNYFGYTVEYPEDCLKYFKQHDGIIIEDITHSLLSKEVSKGNSDYFVASLRKWGALLDGGYCSSSKELAIIFTKQPDSTFLEIKEKAMKEKLSYTNGKLFDKETFLSNFNLSNHILARDYSGLSISDVSKNIFDNMPFQEMVERRRENAKALYEGLKHISHIRFLFSLDKMECPLFVPVLLDKNIRTKLRQHLIDNKIYCPIHWPRPNEFMVSNLYDEELSLICDQRYNTRDMKRVVNIIASFFSE